MYVPLDAATVATAAVVLAAAGPWRLVELGLVDLPYAAWTGEKGESHRATDGQEFARADIGTPRPRHSHAGWPFARQDGA
jgi:hypothetical protein